jgi:hypothetical protein
LWGSTRVLTAAGAFFLAGACYYVLRRRWLRDKGLEMSGPEGTGI